MYLKTAAFLIALGVCLCGGPQAAETAWRTAGDTRATDNDSVWECALMAEGPIVYAGPIPDDQMGRHRVTVRARTEKLGPSGLSLRAWARKADGGHGEVIGSAPMSGCVFDAPGRWQTFSLEFDVEERKQVLVGLWHERSASNRVDGVEVERLSLKLERVDVPVTVSYAWTAKLRYKHAETGKLLVRLTNTAPRPEQVEVRPVTVDDAGVSATGKAVKFTVPPRSTLSGSVPFAVPAADAGCEVFAELLRNGMLIDRRSGDVFAVSDSPFLFAIQRHGDGFPHILSASPPLPEFRKKVMENWDAYVEACKTSAERMHRDYYTYMEFFAWAKEDATVLTMDTDDPYLAGQSLYTVSRKQIRMLNRLLKSHGIAPVSYVNAGPFGWPGFEVIRRHPEWFSGTAHFDTKAMENYYKQDLSTRGVYPSIGVNYETPSANGKTYLQYHIEQLCASAKMFGWEAFRYDAGPLPPEHFPKVKKALAEQDPPIAIGNNLGVCCLGNQPTERWTCLVYTSPSPRD